MKKPIVLTILDGCGIRENSDGNAFKNANKPTFDYLWDNFPHTLLEASEEAVGLPHGQMGNSEVGHNAIGCGQIYSQGAKLVNEAIESKELYNGNTLKELVEFQNSINSVQRVLGMLGDITNKDGKPNETYKPRPIYKHFED